MRFMKEKEEGVGSWNSYFPVYNVLEALLGNIYLPFYYYNNVIEILECQVMFIYLCYYYNKVLEVLERLVMFVYL